MGTIPTAHGKRAPVVHLELHTGDLWEAEATGDRGAIERFLGLFARPAPAPVPQP